MNIKRPVLWMAAAFLLGELFVYGYDTGCRAVLVYGFAITVLFMLTAFVLSKIPVPKVKFLSAIRTMPPFLYILFIVLAFLAGMLIIKREKPKEAFGYIEKPLEVEVVGEVVSIKNGTYSLSVILKDANAVYDGKKYFLDGILLYISDTPELKIGDTVSALGSLSSFSLPHNDGEFNSYIYYKSIGIYYNVSVFEGTAKIISVKKFPLAHKLYILQKWLSDGFFKYCFSEKDAGTMAAITIGEKSYLDKELSEIFQKNGISHILAVSGLHISLIGMGLFALFRKVMGYLPACVVSGVFVALYVCMTGFGVSGQRALIMFIIVMFGNFIGRSYDLISAVCLALIYMLIRTPYLFLNTGFLFSYLSVFAVGAVMPVLNDMGKWAFGFKFSGKLSGMPAGIAIMWLTMPLAAFNYYEYPIYSIILNMLIIPCMSLLVMLGTSGLVLELAFGFGEILLKGPVHLILLYFENICLFFNKMHVGRIIFGKPSERQMFCAYMLISVFICICAVVRRLLKCDILSADLKIFNNKKIRAALVLFVFTIVSAAEIFILLHRNSRFLKISMLDVGQGECIFIETPKGEKILIDSGSSDVKNLYGKRVEPFLNAHAVKDIDCIIVSHTDNDHCNAIKELLNKAALNKGVGISVKNIILPDIGASDENTLELIRLGESCGCKISFFGRGDILFVGEVEFICLNPDRNGRYGENDRNDSSIVLHMKYHDFDMLFTGDIGEDTEKKLSLLLTECDVLKAAHHGSKYSNGVNLLNGVMPKITLISCGNGNMYGHPHKECIERILETGSKILITADKRQINLYTDGNMYFADTKMNMQTDINLLHDR